MINYLNKVFTKPKEIYIARNMKGSHYFLIMLLVGLALTVLSIFDVIPVANQFSDDYDEIKAAVPAFELVDGKLESEQESYAYQTNSVLFYFDSEDKISTQTIDQNAKLHTAPISIGMLKDQIYFNVSDTSYSFVYSNFDNLSADDLSNLFNNVGNFSTGMHVLLILLLVGLNLFLYITQLIPITLFANLISVYRKTRLNFFQNAKIALLASIIPFLLMHIINAFNFNISNQFEIIFMTSLVIFYMSITEMKKRMLKKNNSSKEDS